MESHIRADEGLQRGQRQYQLSPLDHRRTDNQRKLPADLDLDAIIARIASGELMSTIARELGVTPQALSARLQQRNQDYLAARESMHEARLDQAETWCEGSADALELARARDVWRARSWRASVEVPARWGDKRYLSVDITVDDLGEKLRRAKERTIEGECVAITASPQCSNELLPSVASASDDK